MSAFILVADDDPFNLRLLRELCDAAGHQVQTAESGEEVLEAVSRRRPDLLLLDLDMPGKSGLEVMEILRGDAKLGDVPIIIVTAMGDVDTRSRGLELGADDYVTKPYRVFEIQQRVRNVLRLKAAESRAREAAERAARLAQQSEPPQFCGTSQQFILSLDYEFTRAERYHHPLSVLVTEISVRENADKEDDEILQLTAQSLRSCIRGIDHLFRSGELEYSIILPETDGHGVVAVEERIQKTLPKALRKTAWGQGSTLHIVSASYPNDDAENGEALRKLVLGRLRKQH